MKIVGICRFSLLGRGDWKEFQGVPEEETARILQQRSDKLFSPDRMEDRLATFQSLTLSGIRNQSDPDFLFIVLASESMPEIYKDRLSAMCSAVPQVRLFFMPVMNVIDAQLEAYKQLGLRIAETLQFRLDDDDCLCGSYIKVLREQSANIPLRSGPRAVSIGHVLYSVLNGDAKGVYTWPVDFMSAGPALYHGRNSIYAFGHFNMQRRFEHIIVPGYYALVTHRGLNDTSPPQPHHLKKKGMEKLNDHDARVLIAINFPFLTSGARRLAGLPPFSANV